MSILFLNSSFLILIINDYTQQIYQLETIFQGDIYMWSRFSRGIFIYFWQDLPPLDGTVVYLSFAVNMPISSPSRIIFLSCCLVRYRALASG